MGRFRNESEVYAGSLGETPAHWMLCRGPQAPDQSGPVSQACRKPQRVHRWPLSQIDGPGLSIWPYAFPPILEADVGGFGKATFQLGDALVHFCDCWKAGTGAINQPKDT